MARRPASGNTSQSPVYPLGSAGLPSPPQMPPPAARSGPDRVTQCALHVLSGGTAEQITVTVIWQLPEEAGSAAENLGMTAKPEMTYGMSVVDLHSGEWYVKEIGASTEAVGAR